MTQAATIALRAANMRAQVDTSRLTPSIARNILRDLYAPCIDSLLSWDPCAQYSTPADLSDEDALGYLEHILAGFSLSIRADDDAVYRPVIID